MTTVLKTRDCEACEAPLQNQKRFCSRTCRDSAVRQGALEECAYCGIFFHVPPSHLGRVRFCSPDCRTKGKATLLDCRECGSAFRVKPYRKEVAKYCSTACKNTAQDFGITPEHKRIRLSSEYAEWRTAVFRRDNYTCQECGVRGGYLEADHIKPFAVFVELRFEVDNGRTLCSPCHRLTPTYGGRTRQSAFVKGY